jgi:hypothetical protein
MLTPRRCPFEGEGGGEWCRCLEGQCAAERAFEIKISRISLEELFEGLDLPAGVYGFPD